MQAGLFWPPGLFEVAVRCEEAEPEERPSFQTLVAVLGDISTSKEPAASDANADADADSAAPMAATRKLTPLAMAAAAVGGRGRAGAGVAFGAPDSSRSGDPLGSDLKSRLKKAILLTRISQRISSGSALAR